MEKRFFFHRIELERADITMRHEERSVSIESHTANPIESIQDDAAVTASKTTQLAVIQSLVQLAFSRKGLKYRFQCGRCWAHKICLPNAERINSIPNCAVLFCTSRIGLISVISKETIFFVSAIISIARCASR